MGSGSGWVEGGWKGKKWVLELCLPSLPLLVALCCQPCCRTVGVQRSCPYHQTAPQVPWMLHVPPVEKPWRDGAFASSGQHFALLPSCSTFCVSKQLLWLQEGPTSQWEGSCLACGRFRIQILRAASQGKVCRDPKEFLPSQC